MNAECFYQTDTNTAKPLILLKKDDRLDHLSRFEQNQLAFQQFKGAWGDVALIMSPDAVLLNIYIGAGAGDGNAIQAIASAVMKIPPGLYQAPRGLDKGALLAWSLAQYKFDYYKQSSAEPRILAVDEQALPDVLLESNAIFLVRDLINMPANALGPSEMSQRLAMIAMEHGAAFQEWTGEALLRDRFPAIHAVGRAAADAPRLLSLTWGDTNHPRVTLVGKGVCFDSGGLDIKPAAAMRWMKKDMGGAAHVIGLAQWMMAKRLPIRLQVLIPAVENAVGSRAFRPGDVLTMRNGLTVEIDNTDAEGRLVLADALVKACEDSPELLIDFATLTGAARVAVGTEIAAMFTNDDTLANAVAQFAQEANDPVWRMPLFAGYASMLDSSIADIANSSPSAYAGAITAALFLQRFVTEPVPWLHFDVMAWNISNKPGRPEGGEAMGMLAVGRYLLGRYGA